MQGGEVPWMAAARIERGQASKALAYEALRDPGPPRIVQETAQVGLT
jgi:hypothetical protein